MPLARGDEDLTAFNVACDVAKLLGRPTGLMQDTVRILLEWARRASAGVYQARVAPSCVRPAAVPRPSTMCGRYTYKLTWPEIVALYRLTLPGELPEGLRESYNVAPTHPMPIIRPAGNGRELVIAKWGLIPYWSKPEQVAKPSYSTINARDDRVQTAATYRDSFKKRRCLVPATGWYEWQKVDAPG
ncbi:MAG: SOS response-associated peptidase family protein [Geminicoccaceae bacterium]